MFRLGIVGLRGQAARWAAAARAVSGCQLRCGYHPDRSRHLRRAGFEQTDDLRRLAVSCDAVVIASPTHTHLDYLKRLAGIFPGIVLVEKPALFSLAECRWLMGHLPRPFRSRLFVAQNWRFLPWVEPARRILRGPQADYAIGASFQMTHDFAFKPAYAGSWRSDRRTHPIGPAASQGVHFIDLIHHLFGPIHSVEAAAWRLSRRGTAPDTASILIRTRRGLPCFINTSYAAPASDHIRITSSRWILAYQDGVMKAQHVARRKLNGLSRPPRQRVLSVMSPEEVKTSPLRLQLAAVRELLAGRPQAGLATPEQGIANVAVLEAARVSLRRRCAVLMSEFPLYAGTVRSFQG